MSIIFIGKHTNYTCADPKIETCSANCTKWEFHDSFLETIQMKWDLVCDKEKWVDYSQTIFMFGILVGNMVFGTLADK